MGDAIWVGVQGTVVLWVVSASLAVVVALVLALVSVSRRRVVRYTARGVIDLTRGVPTSLIVIAAGIATFGFPATLQLPTLYPGTPGSLQMLAWTIALALALGSAGHLAEIFRCARAALGRARLEEVDVLGLSAIQRTCVLSREVAAIALAPAGSRLVHHLHNTAFAALFPVTELFGVLQSESSATFRVRDFALLGCVLYAGLSLTVWLLFRIVEHSCFRRSRPEQSRSLLGALPAIGVAAGARQDRPPMPPDVASGIWEEVRR